MTLVYWPFAIWLSTTRAVVWVTVPCCLCQPPWCVVSGEPALAGRVCLFRLCDRSCRTVPLRRQCPDCVGLPHRHCQAELDLCVVEIGGPLHKDLLRRRWCLCLDGGPVLDEPGQLWVSEGGELHGVLLAECCCCLAPPAVCLWAFLRRGLATAVLLHPEGLSVGGDDAGPALPLHERLRIWWQLPQCVGPPRCAACSALVRQAAAEGLHPTIECLCESCRQRDRGARSLGGAQGEGLPGGEVRCELRRRWRADPPVQDRSHVLCVREAPPGERVGEDGG